MIIKHQCSEKVSSEGSWGSFHQHKCQRPATIERDGKWYCKIHDPEYIKEKDKARTEEWERKWAIRRLETKAPMLLDACKRALEASHDPIVEHILQEAIEKVEG